MKNPFITAIIVAAGSSSRMGLSYSKQFIDLLGKTVIERTLRAFLNCERINEIVVVCRDEDRDKMIKITHSFDCNKPVIFTGGGKSRSESVKNGIRCASDKACYYAVHDGARPLIMVDEINTIIDDALKYGCAAPGLEVTDTIKVTENGFITSTPDRAKLRAVQTPQIFRSDIYLKAVRNAEGLNEEITDDCLLVEKNGGRIFISKGSETNIKLTSQNDIKRALMILKERGD